jgi:hypothetical protein
MYQSDAAPWLEFFAWNTDGSAKTDLVFNTSGISIVVVRDNLANSSALSLSAASGPTDYAAGKFWAMGGNKYRVGIATASISSFTGKISVEGSYTGGVITGVTEYVTAYNPAGNPNTIAPATPANVSDAQTAILAKLPAALESGRIAVELDSATRVKLDASQPDYAPVKIDQVTSGTIDPATRSIDDTTPLRFAWPTSGETITVERSINSGAFAAADGAVTFFRTEGAEHWYLLAYDADDRAVGVVRYRLTDGTITRYMTLQVSEQSPVTLGSATRVKLDANQPDYAPALAATALSTTQWTNTLATNLGTTNTTVATNLDVTVSSRSTQTSVDTIDDLLDTEMPALTAAVAAEAVKTTAIQAKTDNLPTDPADQSAVEAAITAAQVAIIAQVDANETKIDAILVDTGTTLPAQIAVIDDLLDTEMPALTAAVAAEAVKTSAIKTKTDNLPTDPADQSLLEAAITAATSPLATPAQVNAEVVDVLSVDTFGELSSPPAATSSLKDKLVWLFMWARNKATATATERKLYADDTTTIVSTETITDDGTTFTKGEAS